MKSFTIYVTDDLRYNPELLFEILEPTCNLISLYEGPKLNGTELKTDSTTNIRSGRGSKNEYTFTFNSGNGLDATTFAYFFKGDLLLQVTVPKNGDTIVQLPEKTSSTIELELRKALLKYTKTEEELKAEINSQIIHLTDQKDDFFECKLAMTSGYIDNSKFIHSMYELCSEFSMGTAPFFSSEMIKFEDRQITHERFYRLTANTKTTAVEFEDYLGDSGSHSYPNPFNYEFIYRQDGQIMIHVFRSGNELIFKTRFEDYSRFKMRVLQYFGEKI